MLQRTCPILNACDLLQMSDLLVGTVLGKTHGCSENRAWGVSKWCIPMRLGQCHGRPLHDRMNKKSRSPRRLSRSAPNTLPMVLESSAFEQNSIKCIGLIVCVFRSLAFAMTLILLGHLLIASASAFGDLGFADGPARNCLSWSPKREL